MSIKISIYQIRGFSATCFQQGVFSKSVKKEEKRKKVDINICKCQKMPPKIIIAKGNYRVKVVRRSSVIIRKTVVGYPAPKKKLPARHRHTAL